MRVRRRTGNDGKSERAGPSLLSFSFPALLAHFYYTLSQASELPAYRVMAARNKPLGRDLASSNHCQTFTFSASFFRSTCIARNEKMLTNMLREPCNN